MNLTFDDPQIYGILDRIFRVVEGIEFLLILASIGIVSALFYLFLVAPLFHVNFIRLNECLFFAFVVSTIARVVILIGKMIGIDKPGTNVEF